MSDNEERRVRARHDVTQFYQRRAHKKTVTRRELPQAGMAIKCAQSLVREEASSDDDDVEDETYIPTPRAPHHGKGKGLASASGSGAANEEIEEEAEGDDGDEEEEIFDVEEVNPPNYVQMGTPIFKQPLNPDWRTKVSYKGKTELFWEKRKENPRLHTREATDYRFHTFFQQDLYESMIITKGKPIAISQWIDWSYMENKHDLIFDDVVAACRAKHLRDVIAFKNKWNNEVIAQFFATLFVEEHEDTSKLHWMTEGQWFEVPYAQFAILLGFGRKDANRIKIHLALQLDARKIKFMYPRSKQGNFGETTDMLPFYAYIN
jgi:hypothetical protein